MRWRIRSCDSSHLSLYLYLFFTHSQTHTHTSSVSICVHEHRVYTVRVRASLICVYVCTQARDFLFFFVYPGHIVWTGKMRMDGIVITEWRYPHSVKLEKAGRKPPTGTASKEREVVMVIGEFKQGFANLRGKRCECVRASCSCVCVCWVAVVIWGVFMDSFCEQGEKKLLRPWWRHAKCDVFNFSTFGLTVSFTWTECAVCYLHSLGFELGCRAHIMLTYQKLTF